MFELLMKPETFAAICTLIGVIVTALIAPIVKAWSEKFFKKKDDSLTQALEVSALVDIKLDNIQRDLSADKLWILQFHNGGNFYPTNKSVKKFSVFYEKLALGVQSTKLMYQNVPVHLFHKFVDTVKGAKFMRIEDFSDPTAPKYDLEVLADMKNVCSMYSFALCNSEGQLIGIMGVEFQREVTRLDEIQIRNLLLQSGAISALIDTHLNKK